MNRCCPRALLYSPPFCNFLPLFLLSLGDFPQESVQICSSASSDLPLIPSSVFLLLPAIVFLSSLWLFFTLGHSAEILLFTHPSPKLTEHLYDHCPELLLVDCLLPLCLALLLGFGFVPSFGTYPCLPILPNSLLFFRCLRWFGLFTS